MSYEYTTRLNQKDISLLQLQRVQLSQEVGFISSYNLNFNKVDFTVPFNQSTAIYDTTPLNDVALYDSNGNQVFAGYITTKEEDNCKNTIKATATGYLNQLSKKDFSYSDTGYTGARAYFLQLFQKYLLPSLPYIYPINVHFINDNLLNNISLFLNSGSSTEAGITTANDIATILNTAAYLENGVLKFAAFPETFPTANTLFDLSNYLDTPLNAKEMYQYYYDTVSMDYYNAPGGSKKNITLGAGSLIKKISPSNMYFDDASATALVQRTLNIYSKIYSQVDFQCRIDANLSLCSFFGYKNPQYRNYAFFITSLENAYTHYKVKAIGIKI